MQKFLFELGVNTKKTDNVLRLFEQIHNHIYANDGLSPDQVFSSMLAILSLKLYDEKLKKNLFYKLPQEDLTTFNERIYSLMREAEREWFSKNDIKLNISICSSSLVFSVEKLQTVSLLESSKDVKGLAFQKFVNVEHRRGRGQFFTPEQIVNLCVKIINPQQGECLLDPACGTGSFLSQAFSHIQKNNIERQTPSQGIYGIEINPTVAQTAFLRMSFEDAEDSSIVTSNGLDDWSALNSKMSIGKDKVINFENYFDVILTNPPFGSQGRISNRESLLRFDLGKKWESDNKSEYRKTDKLLTGQVPDILFIERCLDFLKPGGRMAIVLPNGDLENSSLSYLRNYILERAFVKAVINLPHETFVPFGTGVKASILFLEKKAKKQTPSHIFFGKVTKLGYSANKTATIQYKKSETGDVLLDSSGKAMVDEDITDVIQSFRDFSAGREFMSDNCFALDYNLLDDRFDFEYYLPVYTMLEEKIRNDGGKRLGEVASILKRKFVNKCDSETVNYVELSDINTENMLIASYSSLQTHELPSRATYRLKTGDILTAVAGNAIGTSKHMSAYVTDEFSNTVSTNGLRILKAKAIDPYYLLFFLQTEEFKRQVYRYRTGAAIPSISDENLKKIMVPIPDKETLNRISEGVRKSFELRSEARNLLSDLHRMLQVSPL